MVEIKSSIYRLISDQFSVTESEVTDDTGPGDLPKWDSIGQLRLILSLEEEFGVQFSVDDVMTINSIRDIVQVVERYKGDSVESVKGQHPAQSVVYHPVKVPATVYWGQGSVGVLGEIVQGRVALITGVSGYSEETEDRIRKTMPEQIELKRFTRPEGEPFQDHIIRLSEKLQSFRPEHIVAVGGGSTIDTAKLAWLLYEKPGFQLNQVEMYKHLGLRKEAKFIAVPTTFGSGSEASSAAAFSEKGKTGKCIVFSHELLPDQVILDPSLGQSATLATIYASAFDALTHAIEGYVSIINHRLLATNAVVAIKSILTALGQIINGGITIDALETLCYASYNAGIVQNHSSVGLTHSLAHQVGSFGVGHGAANSFFLVPVIQCNSAKTEIYAKLVSEVGFSSHDDFIDHLNMLLNATMLWPDGETLAKIAQNRSRIIEGAMDDITFRTNPVVLDRDAVEWVFNQAINQTSS